MPTSYTPFTMDDGPSLPKPLMTGPNNTSRPPSPEPSPPRSPIAALPPRPPALRNKAHEIAFAALCCQSQFIALASLFQTVSPLLILADYWDIHDYGTLSWFTAGYSLTVGSFMLPAGRLGDIFGHKRMFIFGWLWFAVWSLAAGFCTENQLILFSVVRALQGIGPALCIPNAMALIGRTFPVGPKRNLCFAAFGAMGPSGASIGGIFSAVLAQYVQWHWEFYVLAIWCFVLAVVSWYVVPNPPTGPGSSPLGNGKGKAPMMPMAARSEADLAAEEYVLDKQRRFEQDQQSRFEQEQQEEHLSHKLQHFQDQEMQNMRQSRRVSGATMVSQFSRPVSYASSPLSVYIGGQSYVAFPAIDADAGPSPVSPIPMARPPPFAPTLDRLPSPPLPPSTLLPPPSPLPRMPAGPPKPTFDWAGCITGVLGLVLINFAVNQAPLVGWGQAYIIGPCLVGVLSLALFCYIENRPSTKHPLVPFPDLTKAAVFSLACIFVGWSSHGIWIYYLYIFLEHLRGESAVGAATQILPVALTGALYAVSVPTLMKKFNVSLVMFAAMTFFLVGSLIIALMPLEQTYWANTFVSLLVMPGAMNLSFPAASILLSSALPPEKQGVAASLVATMVNYSISCGLGLAGSISESVALKKSQELGETGPQPPLTEVNAHLTEVRLVGLRAAYWFAVALGGLGMLIAGLFYHISRVEEARRVSAERATEEGRQQEEAERKGLLGVGAHQGSANPHHSQMMGGNPNYQYLRRDSVIGVASNTGLPKTFSMGGTTVMSLGSNGTYYMKERDDVDIVRERDETDADNTTLHEGSQA